MHTSSSLSVDQREAAVTWFEKGIADRGVAGLLGVSPSPVRDLYRRWKIHGRGALVTKPTKQPHSFKIKLALVERFLAAETAQELAVEAGLFSPKFLKTWARKYRRECADALRAKPKGRTQEAR